MKNINLKLIQCQKGPTSYPGNFAWSISKISKINKISPANPYIKLKGWSATPIIYRPLKL